MSEKNPISNFFDKRKLEKSNHTRIHDKAKAEEMAYAEKPHRELATVQKKVGKALVTAAWNNYPNLGNEKIVPVSDVAAIINGEVNETDITQRTYEGLKDLYNRTAKSTPTSVRGEKKQRAKLDSIAQADPTALPNGLAQEVGYELIDTTAANTLEVANHAGEMAGRAHDIVVEENVQAFREDFDRAHGQ